MESKGKHNRVRQKRMMGNKKLKIEESNSSHEVFLVHQPEDEIKNEDVLDESLLDEIKTSSDDDEAVIRERMKLQLKSEKIQNEIGKHLQHVGRRNLEG
jgi:hypothetical protein